MGSQAGVICDSLGYRQGQSWGVSRTVGICIIFTCLLGTGRLHQHCCGRCTVNRQAYCYPKTPQDDGRQLSLPSCQLEEVLHLSFPPFQCELHKRLSSRRLLEDLVQPGAPVKSLCSCIDDGLRHYPSLLGTDMKFVFGKNMAPCAQHVVGRLRQYVVMTNSVRVGVLRRCVLRSVCKHFCISTYYSLAHVMLVYQLWAGSCLCLPCLISHWPAQT